MMMHEVWGETRVSIKSQLLPIPLIEVPFFFIVIASYKLYIASFTKKFSYHYQCSGFGKISDGMLAIRAYLILFIPKIHSANHRTA